MADRTEKLVVNRTNAGTVVKITLIEDGFTVNYSVKSYGYCVAESAKSARVGAENILNQLKESV